VQSGQYEGGMQFKAHHKKKEKKIPFDCCFCVVKKKNEERQKSAPRGVIRQSGRKKKPVGASYVQYTLVLLVLLAIRLFSFQSLAVTQQKQHSQ
jgi:hypothetical protein